MHTHSKFFIYKTLKSTVVLNGCETQTMLGEDLLQALEVFEKTVCGGKKKSRDRPALASAPVKYKVC